MFIKSITIDGFKSYGNRVEITGFDPTFNAITGSDGTGKSNIIDAIVFVLGITKLSDVRAGSLTDLIYKRGQAGITKATVSITFDNRNKSQAPVGYESSDEITITRQIIMGDRNKYMINGIIVQNQSVSDLFCSVQLNVNNPHFLIMQGGINKMLKMKPSEILSMVEEAAGTSMYESKKRLVLNTITKKDALLSQLDQIIKADIAPKLQKLKDDRKKNPEHQHIVRELDGLSKLHKAYQYDLKQRRCAELEKQIEAREDEIKAGEALIKENVEECKAIEKEIAPLPKKLDAGSSGVVQELEEMLGQEAASADACAVDCDVKVSEIKSGMQRDPAAQQETTGEVVEGYHERDKEEVALRSRARRDALRTAAHDAELRCQELGVAVTSMRKEEFGLRRAVATLVAREPWIEAEKQLFGQAGGVYDFAVRKADKAAARMDELTRRRDELACGLNARARYPRTKEEELYAELLQKKGIVEADRRKLQETIRWLDEKKRSRVLSAVESVERDFGAVLASLLPGAVASLAPPPGCAVLDGLEVRVSFAGVWKESLDELSDGQRSLVALALVLAMLRCKPAPLLILDEVDAALDLSQTQDIGLMLRDHFQTSQMIIVSLKEGMFNNANVLFRTSFQDDLSAVQRTENDGARALPAP